MIQRIDSLFLLHTKHSTYCFRVTEQGFLQHLHYGCRLDVSGGWQGLIPQMRHIPANAAALDGLALEDTDLEISAPSMGDLRECFLTVRAANGDTLTDFRFEGAEILDKKPDLEGLPSSYDSAGKSQTLRVVLAEKEQGLRLELLYTTFDCCDVITRSARLINDGEETVTVLRLLSNQVDFDRQDLVMTTFNGAWAREFEPTNTPCGPGTIVSGSRMGFPAAAPTPL